jgi:glycosyltransferase involved in cell wall biosynthesis
VTRRILVVSPWKRRWEMGRTAGVPDDYYFIEGLARRGVEVHYVSPRHDGPPDIHLENYHLHAFPNVLEATERWPSLVRRPLWPVLFTACAVRAGSAAGRRFPPSLVLGQTHLSAPAVRLLARRFRVPSAVKLFGVEDLDRRDWSRWTYLRRNAEQVLALKVPQDAWIILDDGTGGEAAALEHGVPHERVRLLPNGVNLEWADRVPDPAVASRYAVPPGAAVVLYMARLTEWKRPELFIRAVPRIVQQSRRPVRFFVAGDGARRRACEDLAVGLGVAPAVTFLGPVPHDEIPDLMSLTTVFASTNRRSNRGISTCEAMVCGVPVVAFDVGDTRAVVRDGGTGRLVAEGDVDGFSDAVAGLINDEARRARMSRGARAFARAHFTGWAARVAMECELLDRLGSTHRAG